MASSFEGGQPPSGEEPGEDPQEFPGHAPEEAPTDEAGQQPPSAVPRRENAPARAEGAAAARSSEQRHPAEIAGECRQQAPLGQSPGAAPADEDGQHMFQAHAGLPPLAAQLDAIMAGAFMAEVEDEAMAVETSSPMAEIEKEATPVSSTARAVEARNGGEGQTPPRRRRGIFRIPTTQGGIREFPAPRRRSESEHMHRAAPQDRRSRTPRRSIGASSGGRASETVSPTQSPSQPTPMNAASPEAVNSTWG